MPQKDDIMIADIFRDVLKHTFNTGHMDMVKLSSVDGNIVVEAKVPDHSIVLTGVVPTSIDKLDGVVGLSRMQILKGFLALDCFNEDGARVTVATQMKGESSVPAELLFASKGNRVIGTYRFMSPEVAEDQIKIPPFKGAVWDVEIVPTTVGMREFTSMNNILSSYEEDFTVKTNGTALEFFVGSAASSQAKITFATGITGSLKHAWAWPLSQVMAILKLYDTSKTFTMAFSSQGALKITVDSGIGIYEYILPARSQQ